MGTAEAADTADQEKFAEVLAERGTENPDSEEAKGGNAEEPVEQARLTRNGQREERIAKEQASEVDDMLEDLESAKDVSGEGKHPERMNNAMGEIISGREEGERIGR